MDYQNFVKRFELPPDFNPPKELSFEDIKATPLNRNDLAADMDAVNSSLEIIRQTRGGTWPSEAVTEEFDFLDLAWHEREYRDKDSFAYAVYDSQNIYIGCFYLYPMGQRSKLSESTLVYDVDASWWVTAEAYQSGYYQELYLALQQWLASSFPFKAVYYSNKEMP